MKNITKLTSFAWRAFKSEETLAVLKIAATFVAFVHSVDEFRKSRRKIGFRR